MKNFKNPHGVKMPLHRVCKVNSLKYYFGPWQGNSFMKNSGKKL